MNACQTIPWLCLSLLLGMIALAHFNRISITVAGAEKIIPERGIDPTQMGMVYSAYLFVYTLAMSPGGWFSDRFGPRLALFVVGAGSALFLALTGVAGMLWTGPQLLLGLIVIRGLMGFVNAPTHPSGAQFVGQWIPAPQRNLVNGMIGFAACIGVSLTYFVFGMLMDEFEWPGAFDCRRGHVDFGAAMGFRRKSLRYSFRVRRRHRPRSRVIRWGIQRSRRTRQSCRRLGWPSQMIPGIFCCAIAACSC